MGGEIKKFVEGVSVQFLEFVKQALDRESLGHWDVHIWGCKKEGLCLDDDLVICLGLCETEAKTKLLLLHEIAHAISGKIDWEDSYWHRDGWGKEYSRLCKEHLGVIIRDYKNLETLHV